MFPRAACGRAEVAWRHGRGAQVGDAVELWGANLSVDRVAQASGTIGYELLTKVTARVPRRYC
mgnify:CR=1 FL=1